MLIEKKSNVIKRFLVLSDLHIISLEKNEALHKHYREFQREFLKFLDKHKKLDYVLVAGDLTNQNDPEGYKELHKFLNKIASNHIAPDSEGYSAVSRIVCCAGNHDQDRGKIDALMRVIADANPNDTNPRNVNVLKQNAMLKYLNEKEDSFEQLAKIHEHKFEEYLKFIENFYPQTIAKIRKKVGFTLNFKNLLISSLNSAWFCDYPDRRLSDEGHLILGKKYVERAFEFESLHSNQNSSIPRITIMHHPPENFVWQEVYNPELSENTMQYITSNSSLLISGHVHGVPRTMGFDNSAYLISNGTSYNTSLRMSFIMFDLNLFDGKVNLNKYKIEVKKMKTKLKFNIEKEKQINGFQRFRVPLVPK